MGAQGVEAHGQLLRCLIVDLEAYHVDPVGPVGFVGPAGDGLEGEQPDHVGDAGQGA